MKLKSFNLYDRLKSYHNEYLTEPFLLVNQNSYKKAARRRVQMSKSHVQRYVKNSTPKIHILENIRQLTDILTCFVEAYFRYIFPYY